VHTRLFVLPVFKPAGCVSPVNDSTTINARERTDACSPSLGKLKLEHHLKRLKEVCNRARGALPVRTKSMDTLVNT
jgi:hypothetical protein